MPIIGIFFLEILNDLEEILFEWGPQLAPSKTHGKSPEEKP